MAKKKSAWSSASWGALAPAPGVLPTGPPKGLPAGTPQPAPVVTPQPFDPNLALQQLTAGRNIGLGDAESAWQTGNLQRSSGFDANGNLIQSGQSGYNPYSQATLLQDNFKRSQAGTLNSAGNQLYSGSHQNAIARDNRMYAQNFDALKTGTLGQYHGIGQGKLQNYAANSSGVGDAAWQSLYNQVYPGGS